MIFSNFKWDQDRILELSNASRAFIYYRTTRLNLITGFLEVYPVTEFLKKLDSLYIQSDFKMPTVFHFYYELGLVLMGLSHSIGDEAPLAIEIEYNRSKISKRPKSKLQHIPLKSIERPSWTEYKLAFSKIQEELLDGNCYQVNLTFPFDFETEKIIDPRDLSDFFFSRDGLSAYAHSTFLGDEMIMSNSPECLFQFRGNKIYTMPIKGTAKIGEDWKKEWEKMLASSKEESELNMITDLLRNDLNKLDRPTAKVHKARAPLVVPGLLHQCSILSVKLEKNLTFKAMLENLFPGGSVTGAPKKRVMQILLELERYARGIYCGSTLLCFRDQKVANINIRTASLSINEKLWRYGAGGGVTLLSRPVAEFQEMESKVASFLTLLNVPGYTSRKF